MKKELILYVSPALSSFVKGDVNALSNDFEVRYQSLKWGNKGLLPINFIRQFFFLVANTRKSKAIIASFAGYHTFLPVVFAKLFGKKIFIVLNGTESVGIAELNYGTHLKPLMRRFCKHSLRKATELWPVSSSLINGENSFTGSQLRYGVQVSFPELSTPYCVIPNGIPVEEWKMVERSPKEVTFLTVISSAQQFNLKGVDLICQYAADKPNFAFTVVGMEKPHEMIVPPNVDFLGRILHESLSEVFNQHKYYFQLSSFEGFGVSLCEAMLCGCIPIGSCVNEIPVIIGSSGVVLPEKKLEELHKAVNYLESLSEEQQLEKRISARNSIISRYAVERRLALIRERLKYHNIY